MKYFFSSGLFCLALFVDLTCPTFAQDVTSFEKRVTKKVLGNGFTVLIVERPEAPVFSYFTYVDVGSDREVPGITGLAHMFEHMAFKGTDQIGTTDFPAEKTALEAVEKAYHAYDQERRREVGKDPDKTAALEKAFKNAILEAQKYVAGNEFDEILDEKGGRGVNAFTTSESTGYFYSLPSNQLELWAYLESERFLKPVLREFYKERDVVHEERRMRTDSNPIGRLIEQFLVTAYVAHPYGLPVVGWPSDLESFSATDAEKFYKRYYIPANMVLALVGDVTSAEALPVIEKYFGRLPASEKPEPLRTIEPTQNAERTVTLYETAQPFYIEGYHKPSARDKDDAVYAALQDLFSNGRTSRLYRSLVRDKKIAAEAGGFNGFPGNKYPNLFVFYAISTPGHRTEEIRDALRAEIERLKNEDITDEELKMIKTRRKADLLRRLVDNQGIALQFATNEALFGDWREDFHYVDRIDKISKADIRRAAQAIFLDSNRTVGVIKSKNLAKAADKEKESQ